MSIDRFGLLLAVVISFIVPSTARGITLGQVDTFEDGTAQGWFGPTPVLLRQMGAVQQAVVITIFFLSSSLVRGLHRYRCLTNEFRRYGRTKSVAFIQQFARQASGLIVHGG